MRAPLALLCVLPLAAGCDDALDPLTMSDAAAPLFTQAPAAACATAPDFIVHTRAELDAALATAVAGAVIAIDGTIEVTPPAPQILTPDIQLTCATPGSGLVASATARPGQLLFVLAPRVVVSGLRLDGHFANQSATLVRPGPAGPAHDVRITHNDYVCGTVCIFVVGAQRVLVADNRLTGDHATSGIHVQSAGEFRESRTDGTRVERNVIVTTTATANPLFGGIRVRDGRGLLVADNTVLGPWANGISPAELESSVIEQNVLEGAIQFGIGFVATRNAPFLPISVTGTTIRNNRIRHAGTAAVFMRDACQNVLLGNLLQSASGLGVAFDERTGGNTYVGNAALVANAGAFDCDGDGSVDPNMITGPGRARSGPLGFAIRDAVQLSSELR